MFLLVLPFNFPFRKQNLFIVFGKFCCTSIIIVKFRIQLEVFLPGSLVVNISCLNYSCKLATDQFSVLQQIDPNFLSHRRSKQLQVQVDICSSSLQKMRLIAFIFGTICIRFDEFSNDQFLARKKCQENHFLLVVLES